MRSRIREIRKAKGLTLADVAARVRPTPTTAQTIGRLETGRRGLSVGWLNRIAAALEVDPSALISLPQQPDCPLVGLLGPEGLAPPAFAEMVDLRLAARDPVALRVSEAVGDYRPGDILICDRVAPAQAAGHDCALATHAGGLLFGRLICEGAGAPMLATPPPNPCLHRDLDIAWAARLVMLLRHLG
ncbi:MAG: helix-turn-helix domain-containing protein [Pseudomonadota bacterium]